MRRGVKKKEYENLTASNIQKVIKLLSPESGTPITKKEACSILNISYNTKRLDSIIQEHNERVEYRKLRKQQNRGKPAQKHEIAEAVQRYLRGDSVQEIATGLYRSVAFVNNIIETVGVPQRVRSKEEKVEVDYLPDECTSESFHPGEIVWSAVYHTAAKIVREYDKPYVEKSKGLVNTDYEKEYSNKVYSIYVIEDVDTEGTYFSNISAGGFYASSIAYDLGKLSHLEQYGIDLTRL